MSPETIVIGSDHAGFELKRVLKKKLAALGYSVADAGTDDETSVDYPDFAQAVVQEIVDGHAARGVLICGTGIGMSIAANRNPGIRAALVHSKETARLAREHNDANVLVLGSRMSSGDEANWLETFLSTAFEGGRHERRVAKLGGPVAVSKKSKSQEKK